MKIDLFFTPNEVKEEGLDNRTVLVIDVLRASTTIAYALHNGCKEIIPTGSMDAAIELSRKIGRDAALLCGEREGKKIEGFDLGNSPFEYEAEKIKDKTLIFATTNGSKAVVRGAVGLSLAVGSFVNFQTVADFLDSNPNDLSIVCSGKLDQFSVEDAVCGGMYVDFLVKKGVRQLNDAAYAALKLFEAHQGNLLGMLKNSSHGQYLIDLGFERDLHLCSEVNSLQVLPVLVDGRLVRGS